MTRKSDLKSKETISFKARDEAEKTLICNFKSLCIQDGIDQIDFFSEALNLLFRVHNWPPGNPQLTMANYMVKPLVPFHCGYVGCKGEVFGSGVYLPKKQTLDLCGFHFKLAKNTCKVWGDLKKKEGVLP